MTLLALFNSTKLPDKVLKKLHVLPSLSSELMSKCTCTNHVDELRQLEAELDGEHLRRVADRSNQLVVAAVHHQVVVQALRVVVAMATS